MTDLVLLLLIDGLLAAGLGVAVGLFFGLKREISRLSLRRRRGDETLAQSLDQLKRELDGLRAGAAEFDRRLRELPPPVADREMDPVHRAQVLRMHRRGERPEQIAAALGLPLGEVDLLLKLYRISNAA
ncbi:MAG TPA: hypothetical protein ENJ62_06795 [Bryobacterales bacterium]|nr:hypothetical protein [Bryobacterales bacterium]